VVTLLCLSVNPIILRVQIHIAPFLPFFGQKLEGRLAPLGAIEAFSPRSSLDISKLFFEEIVLSYLVRHISYYGPGLGVAIPPHVLSIKDQR
jgi:hypothetical protein